MTREKPDFGVTTPESACPNFPGFPWDLWQVAGVGDSVLFRCLWWVMSIFDPFCPRKITFFVGHQMDPFGTIVQFVYL